MYPTIEVIQEFFFEAALATYAGGAKKGTITDFSCSNAYRYQRGDFYYVKTYFTNGEWSGGQTLIYFQGAPIWIMQCQGWCKNDDPGIVAFLKEVLRVAYERKQFFGGRGSNSISYRDSSLPTNPERRELFYTNEAYGGSNEIGPFKKFIGHERIEGFTPSLENEMFFWHRYQGMLLIENPERS